MRIISHMLSADWMKWHSASGVFCKCKLAVKLEGKFYRMMVAPAMLYGAECWVTKNQYEHKKRVAEIRMLRWMYAHTWMDNITTQVF